MRTAVNSFLHAMAHTLIRSQIGDRSACTEATRSDTMWKQKGTVSLIGSGALTLL
jgi:hypothetical protein